MIKSDVFDEWADEYDEDVRIADKNDEYPFAGYRQIMGCIYNVVTEKKNAKILDIGIGTGFLSSKLCESGCSITGVDFSQDMLDVAKSKMQDATLFLCDFANGLPPEVKNDKYDFIISTYALHHLTDALKVCFIKSLKPMLCEGGQIIIGDIGFKTRDDLECCKKSHPPDEWDDNEHYFVFEEISEQLADSYNVSCTQISHCAGLMYIVSAR